ncbi:hypothetical protein GF385_01655 [Candidatus Dependentiae bacterium]|nr:hypothetical protein [Candidatus Dependentiae bacterium]
MKKTNQNIILNFLAVLVTISAFLLCFYYDDEKTDDIKIEQIEPAEVKNELGLTKKQLKYAKKLSHAPTYDYQNLLYLMNKCRKIEKKFYANFRLFIQNHKNLKNLKKTLKELKEEKGFFKKYIKRTKQYYSRSAPSRKRDSLRYYFRVLEDNIDELKKMIERFNLHVKIQIKNHNKNS